MKFRQRFLGDPEINLIPFIDVLLVIIIFLMLTTAYSSTAVLQIQLPESSTAKQQGQFKKVEVAVSASGGFAINNSVVSGTTVEHLTDLLKQAAGGDSKAVVVINADSNAPYQLVVNVMDAASQAGLERITVMTRNKATP